MVSLVLLATLASLLTGNMGKIFQRCELAQVLHHAGMDGFRGYSLADWLCLAFHESRFDTGTVDHEADGSTDNGIFQINSRLWCEDYKSSARNLCHMHCSGWPGGNIVRAATSPSGWKDVMWEVDEGMPGMPWTC
nr:sperm acrosome membrane-associated protein 3-like isoform X2 [Pelodiscus sinensis]|eukprot:XP_025043465.1 sperm acrosome membrane-associated protein 3-like isoform X2 [Pelodiscus sinensis]